ncbi:hypothetical protein AKO1_004080 [Acrasis kona]|uniref:NFD4 C-terminal domain-containing protein n=1 Tax=Acrasis kona TaxID=1008807 RepID=A0AAW2YUP8_9EUKA
MSACKFIYSNPYLMAAYALTFASGLAGIYCAGMTTNMKNFGPKYNGMVIGSLMFVYGLSSGVFSLLYKFVLQSKLLPFILTMTIVAGVIPLCTGFLFVGLHKEDADAPLPDQNMINRTTTPVAGVDETTTLIEIQPQEIEIPAYKQVLNRSSTTLEMLKSIDFYLLYIVYFCGVGTGLGIYNNLSSIVDTHGYGSSLTADLVVMYSVFSSCGRVSYGVISDCLRNHINRFTFMSFSQVGLAAVSFGFAYTRERWMFYPLMAGLGLFYGGMNATIAAAFSERFGNKHYAVNYAVLMSACPISSYLFGTLMTSYFYQRSIKVEGGKMCFGPICYMPSFLLFSCMCMFGFLTCLFLMYRTRKMFALRNEALAQQKMHETKLKVTLSVQYKI